MKLRVICQICGATTVIDTEKPVGQFPRWDSYTLEEFDFDNLDIGVFRDYEIWICPECHKKVSEYQGLGRDETGEYYEDWEINWEKFSETVERSLSEAKQR